MARHKSFGLTNPLVGSEPVTFDIYDETFTCKAAVQGAALLHFGKNSQDNASQAVLDFFNVVMDADEFQRFEELINSDDKIVPADVLGEIAGYLISEYTARPTERSSSSAPTGRPTTGRTSARRR